MVGDRGARRPGGGRRRDCVGGQLGGPAQHDPLRAAAGHLGVERRPAGRRCEALNSDGTLVQTVLGVLRDRSMLRQAATDANVALTPAYSLEATLQPGQHVDRVDGDRPRQVRGRPARGRLRARGLDLRGRELLRPTCSSASAPTAARAAAAPAVSRSSSWRCWWEPRSVLRWWRQSSASSPSFKGFRGPRAAAAPPAEPEPQGRLEPEPEPTEPTRFGRQAGSRAAGRRTAVLCRSGRAGGVASGACAGGRRARARFRAPVRGSTADRLTS